MLKTFGLLLGCQLIGEVAVRGLGVPIPGPVVGLAFLLIALCTVPSLSEDLRSTIGVILANLSLMFVPAGVGVIGNLEALSSDWLALLVILTLSTTFSMLAAVGTFIAVRRLTERRST